MKKEIYICKLCNPKEPCFLTMSGVWTENQKYCILESSNLNDDSLDKALWEKVSKKELIKFLLIN